MGSRSFSEVALLTFYTEQPLHCGAEKGTGYVDLPVQREKHTGFPVIPGSTIKGVLRDEMKAVKDFDVETQFGKEDSTLPGRIAFGDGFVVAFPVRSSGEPFRWVTCPLVLDRVYRALGEGPPPFMLDERAAWASTAQSVLLEEIRVDAVPGQFAAVCDTLDRLLRPDSTFAYTRLKLRDRLIVVTDRDFGFLVATATEIVTRIKLSDETGTTTGDGGNMFNEELVPRDTLFACVVRERSGDGAAFPLDRIPDVIRLGGDETIGRGVVWVHRIARAIEGA
ncbi:MAG: type III-B CRISPR module RAMP protein Cmr4 [Acidobacteriota bacterium]